jgi:ABC-type uncharacterized transport system substrate-binding protein
MEAIMRWQAFGAGVPGGTKPGRAGTCRTIGTARLKANVIFFETLVSPRLAETLAAEVGAKTLVLFGLTGPVRRLRAFAALAVVLVALAPAAAHAHPHVWIDYEVVVRFGPEGPEGVRVDWAFDEMLSSLIIQKYDADRDGKFSPAESRALEKEHLAALKDFNYFVELRIDGKALPVTAVKDFEARNVRGQLHYLFTVPVRAARQEGVVDINVTDPTYYSAFSMAAKPISFEGGPNYRIECTVVTDPKTKLREGLRCTYQRQGR